MSWVRAPLAGLRAPPAPRRGSPRGDLADRPAIRRQTPFEGSMRQRRGRLLRQFIAEGVVTARDADREAAAGLAQDGLVVLADGRLLAPE